MAPAAASALLERAAELAALEARLAAVRADGSGRIVLVAGEAGIGKTALARAFCARRERVLWGGCDALFTPRPLGPVLDIAEAAGGQLAAIAGRGATPSELVTALAAALPRRGEPATIVLEDLHWADEATLDVIRLLTRRLERLPALVLATYRDDELDRAHPLRIVLGELPRGDGVARLAVPPLSTDAVGALAGERDVDAERLRRLTGGNAFFVTEALAAGSVAAPETVRDAVLARAARLSPGARALLEAIAIVPARAELWLLDALGGEDVAHLEDCLASGMLRAEHDAVAFRHEIARLAFEKALPPHRRRELHRRALTAIAARPPADLARLAHHAEAAGDAAAVLRYAPAAGERAATLGAHREAAAQFARALRHADGLPSAERADLLERRSYECYLTDAIDEAIDARRAALEEHQRRRDARREGDAHRWLSRLAWFKADQRLARQEAALAVELLESLPPGRELAMAYSNQAQLRMLASDTAAARLWGEHAIALAERLDEPEILAHALNNVGMAELHAGLPSGVAKLERSLEIALANRLEEHVARAYTNLGAGSLRARDYASADRRLAAGIAYSEEHDLDSWRLYMLGWVAHSRLEQGHWDNAADAAASVLRRSGAAAPSRIMPLTVLGCLRARRGDPDVWPALDEALALAQRSGELQRLAPVAAARAEARWLAGSDDAIDAETGQALERALELSDTRWLGELCLWRARAGVLAAVPEQVSGPAALELRGEWEAAAAAWAQVGCPYAAALALTAGDEAGLRRGHDALQALGARRAAGRVARMLRERGARHVRSGPRAATRSNPAGLTVRELQVLGLVAEGRRNAEIAAELFVAEKTVDHHVSSILRKLGVQTRGQASAEAARLGIGAGRR